MFFVFFVWSGMSQKTCGLESMSYAQKTRSGPQVPSGAGLGDGYAAAPGRRASTSRLAGLRRLSNSQGMRRPTAASRAIVVGHDPAVEVSERRRQCRPAAGRARPPGRQRRHHLIQRLGVRERERPRARPAQRRDVRARAERTAEIARQRPHVRPLRAVHAQVDRLGAARTPAARARGSRPLRASAVDRFSRARVVVKRSPGALERRIHRRHLRDCAAEAGERALDRRRVHARSRRRAR